MKVTKDNAVVGLKVTLDEKSKFKGQDKGSVYGEIVEHSNCFPKEEHSLWVQIAWKNEDGKTLKENDYQIGHKDKFDLNVYEASIKPKDMVSGDWYKVVSILANIYIFKFDKLVRGRVYFTSAYWLNKSKEVRGNSLLFESYIKDLQKASKEEVEKYYPNEFKNNNPEVLVFGKFKIGSIVVSLTKYAQRNEGDILEIVKETKNGLTKSGVHSLVYTNSTIEPISSDKKDDFRAATDDEIKAFEQGITNINDIKTEEDLVGRYIKAIYSISNLKRGEYDLITSVDGNFFRCKKSLTWSKSRLDNDFELMPIGFTPEESINTYGLKVGDVLPAKIVNAWCKEGKNLVIDSNWNQKTADYWNGENKTISYFDLKNNIVTIFFKENSSIHGIKAEGFKEFMDNFDKPKHSFKDNTWYKVLSTTSNYYVKNKFDNDGLDSFREHIDDSTYFNSTINLGLEGTYQYKEVDISEIQDYLPDNHIDKFRCQTCEDTSKVMVAKLYPQGHTEVTEDCPDCLVKPKNINTMELPKENSLLEEAKRRYPIGTKYYLAHLPNDTDTIDIIDSHDFEVCKDGDISLKGKNTGGYNRFIKDRDKWADIITTVSNSFKEGDYVEVHTDSNGGHKIGTIGIVKGIYSDSCNVYVANTDRICNTYAHAFRNLKLSTKAAYEAQGNFMSANDMATKMKTSYNSLDKHSSDASIEEILEYCKRVYTVGTVFTEPKGACLSKNTFTIEQKDVIKITSGKYIDIKNKPYLYFNGEYAKILSSPKIEKFTSSNPLTPQECLKKEESIIFVEPKKSVKHSFKVNDNPEVVLMSNNKKQTNKFKLIIN